MHRVLSDDFETYMKWRLETRRAEIQIARMEKDIEESLALLAKYRHILDSYKEGRDICNASTMMPSSPSASFSGTSNSALPDIISSNQKRRARSSHKEGVPAFKRSIFVQRWKF